MDVTDWTVTAGQAITMYGALQNPTELAVLLTVLAARQPGNLVEIGTWAGGLTWALGQLPTAERIISVDRAAQPGVLTGGKWAGLPVSWIRGDSNNPATRDLVKAHLDGQLADVLIIDGGHDLATATRDWELYRPLVTPGGLIVVHDTQGYPGVPEVQVPALWQRVRDTYPCVELVAHPGGPGGTGIVWV